MDAKHIRIPLIVTAAKGEKKYNHVAYDNKSPKHLPPYSRETLWLLSWGVKPKNDIFIFAGLGAWKKAKAFQDTQLVMCLPISSDPANYFWPVCDCPIILFDTGGLSIHDIEWTALCLLQAKAEIVRTVLASNKLVIYRRSAI